MNGTALAISRTMLENPYKSPEAEGKVEPEPRREHLLFKWLFRDCPRWLPLAVVVGGFLILGAAKQLLDELR